MKLAHSLSDLRLPSFLAVESYDGERPDVRCTDAAGRTCGIEVTRLMDQEAEEARLGGSGVFRDWSDEQLITEIERIVSEKAAHEYSLRPVHLCIQCDEMVVTPERLGKLRQRIRLPAEPFEGIYVLFSYHPHRGYPVTVLKQPTCWS